MSDRGNPWCIHDVNPPVSCWIDGEQDAGSLGLWHRRDLRIANISTQESEIQRFPDLVRYKSYLPRIPRSANIELKVSQPSHCLSFPFAGLTVVW